VIPVPTQLFIIFTFTGAWTVAFMAIIRRIDTKDAEQAQSREATESVEAPEDCVECLARLELVFNRLMSREAIQD